MPFGLFVPYHDRHVAIRCLVTQVNHTWKPAECDSGLICEKICICNGESLSHDLLGCRYTFATVDATPQASVFSHSQNKPVDFFCMILEGRVHVTMGKENLAFESGPFSYFGTQALVVPPSESESPSGTRRAGNTLRPARHTQTNCACTLIKLPCLC